MKKYQIMLFVVAAMAAVSCSEKEELAPVSLIDGNKVQREFTTLATKTVLQNDGTTVVWENTDTISVFDGVANNKFVLKDYTSPSASAKFDGTVDAGATEFYAVYPYAAGNSLDGAKLTASVPVSQKAKTGSFDSGAAVAVAYTDSDVLAFHNVTALIGIKLADTQTNVSSIVLTGNSGEYVAGAVSATLASDGSVSSIVPGTGSKSATLSGIFTAGGMYYLAFIPQEFSEGITVTANYSDGKCARLVSSLEWEAVAGKSYNVVDFGTASYLEFEEDRFTFDYGETKTVNFTGVNVASVNSISLPAGWSYAALGANSVQISAPAKSVVVENEAGVVYKPVGDAVISFTSNAAAAKSAKTVVRLRGINSDEEFNEFRLAYGNGSASFAASSVSYNRRLTDCADYLVGEEITLNDNVTASSQSGYPFYILHHIEHNLNGNGKTFTMNVSSSAWPAGFCQTIYGSVKVHDLKLAGTLKWTYSAAGSTGGCCGGFVGQSHSTYTVDLTFENVVNSVNITWTSASTADPAKHYVLGGFVGVWTDKPVTFTNCTYSGKITKNCRNLATAGFVAWSSATTVCKFDKCTFSGEIESTANSVKSSYTTSSNYGFFGGFVGASDSNASGLDEFKGCVSEGTITLPAGARLVGGFIGKGSCPFTFGDDALGNHCVFSGKINYTETDKIVYGSEAATRQAWAVIGGFVGQNMGQNNNSMVNCIVSDAGLVKVTNTVNLIGGFVGKNDNTFTTFSGNTFNGTIDYTADQYVSGSTERVGGFIGHRGGAKNTITNCHSNGKIYIRKGANTVGGFFGVEPVADTFENCSFGGTIEYTSYATNNGGTVGGFVGTGSGDAVEYVFNDCEVTSAANISTTGYITSFGGFVGNAGTGKATKATFADCNFKGTMTVNDMVAAGNRRVGGFVGDVARQAAFTDCSNSGTMVVHQNSVTFTTTNAIGGFAGRTTAAASGYTMKCDLTGCAFSGTMTIYNSHDPASTNNYGTLIGCNAGYKVTTVDGVVGTSNASINYGTTAPVFLTE